MLNWLNAEKLTAKSPAIKRIATTLESFSEQVLLNLPNDRFSYIHHSSSLNGNVASILKYSKLLHGKPLMMMWDLGYATAKDLPFTFGRSDCEVPVAFGLYFSAAWTTLIPEGSNNFMVLSFPSDLLTQYISIFKVLCENSTQLEMGFLPGAWMRPSQSTIERLSYLVLWHKSNKHSEKLAKASSDVLHFGNDSPAKDHVKKKLFPSTLFETMFNHFRTHMPYLAAIATIEYYCGSFPYSHIWTKHPQACIVISQVMNVADTYRTQLTSVLQETSSKTLIKQETLFDPPEELFKKDQFKKIAKLWPQMKQNSVVQSTLSAIMSSIAKMKGKVNSAAVSDHRKKEIAAKFAAHKKLYLEYSEVSRKLLAKDLSEPVVSSALFQADNTFSPKMWEKRLTEPLKKVPIPQELRDLWNEQNKANNKAFEELFNDIELQAALTKVKRKLYQNTVKNATSRGVTMPALPPKIGRAHV